MADTPSKTSKTLGIPWKPGQSGNPGGRPKAVMEVVALARSYTPEVMAALFRIATNPEAPPAASVAAGNALMDRGWGKPVQAVVAVKTDAANISDAELLNLIRAETEAPTISETGESVH